jgi:hypothetical protein
MNVSKENAPSSFEVEHDSRRFTGTVGTHLHGVTSQKRTSSIHRRVIPKSYIDVFY